MAHSVVLFNIRTSVQYYIAKVIIQTDSYGNAVSRTGEIIANNLNGVISRHLTTVVLYNATLIVNPVAGINTHR